LTIPGSVTSIGDAAFSGCRSLTSVTIPGSVTEIGDEAFAYCSSLTSVTIPGSVTAIGGKAFYRCISLTSVTIPGSVTSIGEWAFSGCRSLTSVTILSSVIEIGKWVFSGCSSLTVAISGSMTMEELFGYWGSTDEITSVTILDGATSIGDRFFYDCSNLTSVTIPNSVKSIGEKAFYRCISLTSVTIPDRVKSIGDGAFQDCSSLTAITVEKGNSFYSSIDGVLFEKAGTVLTQYPGGKAGHYDISNRVKEIRKYAFSGCSSLTSVTIPSSVTDIGQYAFSGCNSLIDITIKGRTLKLDGWYNHTYRVPLKGRFTSLSFAFRDKYNKLGIDQCVYIEADSKRIYPVQKTGDNFIFDLKDVDELLIKSIHPGKDWVPYSRQITLRDVTFHR
jgi:hypothetical protein